LEPSIPPAIHSDPGLTRGHPMPNKRAAIRLLELRTRTENSLTGTSNSVIPIGV